MKRLIAVAVLAGIVYAIKSLPWWAGVGLIVLLVVGGLKFGAALITQFFMGAFKAKSAVLAGASARIHSIEPAPPFKPEDDDDEDLMSFEEPRHWVFIDLDVEVKDNPDTPMSFWSPDELSLVSESAVAGDIESDDEVGDVFGVEMMENGNWVTVEDKVAGSQRLRLHVAARDGIDRFRLRYYFELLKNAS